MLIYSTVANVYYLVKRKFVVLANEETISLINSCYM